MATQCALCKSAPSIVDDQEWAAGWLCSCNAAACTACLRSWITEALPGCRDRQDLRIQCFGSGCRKALPQRIVLGFSHGARVVADAIDCGRAVPPMGDCPCCGQPCFQVVNPACGHGACEACWSKWAVAELQVCRSECRLCAQCCHPSCNAPVRAKFWTSNLPWSAAGRACAAHEEAMERAARELQAVAGTRQAHGPTEAGPICPICCEHRLALLHEADHAQCAACDSCWARWAEENLAYCVNRKAMAVHCLSAACTQSIGQRLWEHLWSISDPVNQVGRKLAMRQQLQRNSLYPAAAQINCPQSGCVGLGYLGFDTVMCFICEHQWIPEIGAGEPPPQTDVEVVMGVTVKRCPQCNEYIEKNGGCDHMTCRCRHEFWWSSLKPYERGGGA